MLDYSCGWNRQDSAAEINTPTFCREESAIEAARNGAPEPADEALFDRSALKAALPEVSIVRYEQTLCAEHPALKAILDS